MKMKYLLPLLTALLLLTRVEGQDFTNKGRDFWLCFPTHVPTNNSNLAKMALFLTSDQNSSGTITVGGFSTSFNVAANQISSPIDIPYSMAHIFSSEAGRVVNKGIHVTVDAGKPAVVLYAHIYASARSEASLILPTHVLGKKYYSMNFIQTRSGDYRSQFCIVAVEPNTTVRYQLRVNGVLDNAARTATLPNVGDVLEIQHEQDLTGSIIESVASNGTESCKKIAVFSGSSALNIGQMSGGSAQFGTTVDPLFQQCYPVNTWGKNFGVVPFVSPSGPFHYRVLASEDNTTVSIDGMSVNLNAGEFFPSFPSSGQQVSMTKPFMINSDKPVAVAQYMLSSDLNGFGSSSGRVLGDPEMVLLNPVEQSINDISVFSSKLENISAQYLNVFIKTNSVGTFKINGNAPKSSFVTFAAPNNAYSYLIENLTNYGTTSFRLTSDSGFNAICYGVGGVESYAYSAGTSVKDFSKIASFQNPFKRIDSAITCVNSPFQFSVPLTFRPSSMTWDFSAAPGISPNASVGPRNNPAYDSMVVNNGQSLYFFSNKITYSFSQANTAFSRDTIKVYTKTNTPDGCGSSDQTFFIPVRVDPLPSANFTFTKGCLGDSVRFFDATTNNGNSFIEKALWDFDDGTTDSIKNPVKKFAAEGTYKVRYRPITNYGCAGDTTIPITFSAPPKAKFGISDTTCVGNTVTFTDSSTTSLGTIAKWTWNFGEGTLVTNNTNAPVTHTYNAVGKYTVTLEVESNSGCKSVVFTKEVEINAAPAPDFKFSETCLPNGDVQFTNLTTIGDGSEAGLRYSWSFGDGASSDEKAPSHRYSSTGPFNANLKAISGKGCIKEVSKLVNTVYPQPKANFSLDAQACVGNSTRFKDESNGGSIVKWRWDFGDGTTDTTQNPTHLYSSAKEYTVKLVVFSDKGCVSDTFKKTTLVNPLPTADFNTSMPRCENQQISISDVSKANAGNITSWNWDFGDGTNASYSNGNPFSKTYNVGQYSIRLSITTEQGCKKDTTKSIRVTALPVANFILPEVCVNDAFAVFTDSSYIPDGSESGFTYNWNFGDGNNSSEKNPKHKYTAPGNYSISLTVTSKDGCSATTSKMFTVNGSDPVADFTVLNDNLCSNTAVQIRNASSVSPGNITKVEIWWDALGAPATFSTDENPVPGKIYTFNYPVSASSKNYTIRFKAYSGGICSYETTKQVTLNASPKVSFAPMPSICFNDAPRQITEATETVGVPGTSSYSGKGVSSTGVFSPQTAGAGTSIIKYVYTSANGCSDSAQQSIVVYPNPQVYAGPDLFVLEGGSIVINADVKGNELSFIWSPSTYLNSTLIQRPTSTPLGDIVYSLSVTSQGGCTGKDDVAVKVLKGPTVPNAFSPNNDGINDTWNIQYLETYPGAVVQVFNRYGQQVYISKGYSRPWDGKVNGNPLPVGVYYYIIDPKNGKNILKGSLTILR